MKATQVMGNDNIVYTYLPISYDTLQSAIYNQQLPITIASNVIMKLPDKNITHTGQNQDEDILANHSDNDKFIENSNLSTLENSEASGATTACIINQDSILNKTDIFKKGKENLKCDTCGKEFDRISNYKKHLLIHRNVKKFKCEHCFESYNIEDNYKLHMALHAQGQAMCPLCKRQFQRLASLKSHLLMHQVEETFVCKECLAEFEKEDEYNRHMESHNLVNPFDNIPYICSYCNYLFEDPKDYKEHVSYHIKIKKLVFNPKRTRKRTTNNKEYSHRCSVCSKSFPKNCLLERHMRIHNGEKPFACTKCDKAFSQKSTLQIHLVKHSGHKPYKCTLCPAEYFQKGNLRVHVQKTHTAPPNIDKMYKCTQCTCIFKKIASLNAHITKAHGNMKNIDELTDGTEKVKALKKICEQLAKTNEKSEEEIAENTADLLSVAPNETFVKLAENSVDGTLRRYVVKQKRVGDTKVYICLYCSKEFKKPSDLIRHIRIHTREKPYKCKTCNQGFALKSTLLSHLNTHDGKREFQCLMCFKFFTSARTLSVHARKHNKSGVTTSLKYKCSTCSKLFSTLAKVRNHMDIHNSSNDDVEKNIVEEEYEAQAPLKQPMLETEKGLVIVPAPKPRIPHGELEEYKDRPYRCHICNAAFLRPTHVKRHMLTHSGEKNFKCDLCSKAFLTPYGLKEHLRFHSTEKKFTCTLCPQKFFTKEFLKRHQIKHSSLKPYLCPYCKKRFKTATLCRKHINTHRNDSNVSNLHTEFETNPAKIIDLEDSMSNPFDLVTIDDRNVFFNSNNNEIQLIENSDSIVPNSTAKGTQKIKSKSRKAKRKSDSKKSIRVPNEDAFSEYSHEVLNLPNNSQIFISRDGHYTIIMPDACEMETSSANSNMGEIDQGSANLVSYDEYQSGNNDIYNTLLSNVKLQNNDPILMSTIGESQDSNILFMDPTLAQTSEFQNDTQNFESFNPTIFNPNVELSLGQQASITNGDIIQSDQSVLSSTKNDVKSTQLKLNFPDNGNTQTLSDKKSNSIMDTSKLLLTPDNINLNDNLIITLNGDDFSNMNFNLNMHSGLNSTVDNLTLNIMENEVEGTFGCSICKITFDNIQDLEKHQCVEPISTELHEIEVDESLNQMDSNGDLSDIQQDEQITLITDYNDQLETTHVEISTDDFSRDSIIEKNQEKVNNKLYKRTRFEKSKKFENVCNYCSKSFKKASDLIRHIRTHTGERPFTCNKCNKSFSLKSTLQSHLRTHSDMRNKYVCQVCNSNYSCRATLKIHMRIHTGSKPYSCQICHAKFRTSSARNSHTVTHAKNSKRNETKNNNKPLGHILETLITNEASSVQEKVGDMSTNSEIVQNNEIQHIETLPIELLQQLHTAGFLVQENGVLGSSLMQLNYESTVHDNKILKTSTSIQNVNVGQPSISNIPDTQRIQKLKKFECNFCHKTYTTKSVLRKHQKRHKKDYHCTKCDKQFDSQDLLEKHVKLHSGYRPFSCTHCANSFSEEGSLKTHIKRIHNVQ